VHRAIQQIHARHHQHSRIRQRFNDPPSHRCLRIFRNSRPDASIGPSLRLQYRG
jgi:hypothetical protein